MKKPASILFSYIVIFSILLYAADFSIYKYYADRFYENFHAARMQVNKFKFLPFGGNAVFKEFTPGSSEFYRQPDGLEYKNKLPAIVFGGSFAFGTSLNDKQTFSGKLSDILKKPVYNRAVIGGSFQQMYMQALSGDFYGEIPKADTVIYIMIGDHYRRMKVNYFDILDYKINPVFNKKNDMLILKDYGCRICNLLNSLYISKHFNHAYINKYINNPKNAQALTDEAVLYFTETRKELQKHYGKDFKFYVILYEYTPAVYADLLIEKLNNAGFIAFSTKQLTDIDLMNPEYLPRSTYHPSAKAWELLTPLIAEKIR